MAEGWSPPRYFTPSGTFTSKVVVSWPAVAYLLLIWVKSPHLKMGTYATLECESFWWTSIQKSSCNLFDEGVKQIHKENPTRCNNVSKFYIIFIWSSSCFGRHTAHHQEAKTALAASDFAYMEGCWTCSCWMLSASSNYTSNTVSSSI